MRSNVPYVHPLVVIFCLAIFSAVGWVISPLEFLSQDLLEMQHGATIAVLLIGLYSVRPFFLWPLSLFSVFIGYLIGFPEGVPAVLLGTLFTCSPPFLLAKHYRDRQVYFKRSKAVGERLTDVTGKLRGMIAARLSPAPADAVSYGAGLAGISVQTFALGTLIGELPWAIFYVFLGQSLQTVSTAAIRQTDIRLILLAAAVSVLLIARPLYEFAQGQTDKDDETSTDFSG